MSVIIYDSALIDSELHINAAMQYKRIAVLLKNFMC